MKILRGDGWKSRNDHIRLLTGIWIRLNNKEIKTEKHAKALCFFTGNLGDIILIPLIKNDPLNVNVVEWIKSDYEGIQCALVNLLWRYCNVLSSYRLTPINRG